MAEDDKKKEATEASQAVNVTDEDEMAMELEAAMMAQTSVDIRPPLNLTIYTALICQVPSIIWL